jgi:hypothetical protein
VQVWDWKFLDYRDFMGECTIPSTLFASPADSLDVALVRGDLNAGSLRLSVRLTLERVSGLVVN